MSDVKTLTGTSINHEGYTPPPYPGGPHDCGGPGQPACPIQEFYEERARLIFELAGLHPSPTELYRATERVDAYLVGVLRAAHALTRGQSGRVLTNEPLPAAP